MHLKNIIKLILVLMIIFVISAIVGYILSNKIFIESTTQETKSDYEDNIDMCYIEKDNIAYKADYIAIDDNKLEMVLNFSFSEDVSSFEGVSLSDFIVEDEKEKLIYKDEEESLSYSIENSNIEVNKNIIKQLYRFKLKEKVNSKKIILKFKKVILYNVNKGNPFTKEISGDWKIELAI